VSFLAWSRSENVCMLPAIELLLKAESFLVSEIFILFPRTVTLDRMNAGEVLLSSI